MRSIPLFLTFVVTLTAFILGMLCLMAGYKPEFIEEFDIITLDASTLGYFKRAELGNSKRFEIFGSSNQTESPRYSLRKVEVLRNKMEDVAGSVSNKVDELQNTAAVEGAGLRSAAADKIAELQNTIADSFAEALNIEDWYSLHVLNMCMGRYMSGEGANKNRSSSSCTATNNAYGFDPITRLEKELASGPFGDKVTLEKLGFPVDEIKSGLDAISYSVGAIFLLYVIGIADAGILACILILSGLASTMFINNRYLAWVNNLTFVNVLLSLFSFSCFLASSIVLSLFMVKASDLINKNGNAIGLYAYKGNKLLAMSWVSTGLMAFAIIGALFIRKQGRADNDRIRSPRPAFRATMEGAATYTGNRLRKLPLVAHRRMKNF